MSVSLEARDDLPSPTGKCVPTTTGACAAFARADAVSAARPSATPTRTTVRILLAEDDDIVRDVGVRFLEYSGYRVEAASDGEAAWDRLRRGTFHLLVTDNNMPRLTGIGLLKRIREAGMVLPAILASGSLPWDELDAPPEFQPVSTLAKPYNGRDLLAKVQAHLQTLAAPFRLAPEVATRG